MNRNQNTTRIERMKMISSDSSKPEFGISERPKLNYPIEKQGDSHRTDRMELIAERNNHRTSLKKPQNLLRSAMIPRLRNPMVGSVQSL